MRRCYSCREGAFEPVSDISHAITVRLSDTQVLQVRAERCLPGWRCTVCGEELIPNDTLRRLELAAADELGKVGRRVGPAFRFMRKALGLRAEDLAELLDVTAETVSRWENDRKPIPPLPFVTLAAMVEDASRGRTDTLDRLRATRNPQSLPATVDIGELPIAS